MADALMDAWKKAEASGDYSGFSYGLRDSGLTPAALQQQYGLSAQDLAYMQSRPGMSGFGAAAPAAPAAPASTPAAGIASLPAQTLAQTFASDNPGNYGSGIMPQLVRDGMQYQAYYTGGPWANSASRETGESSDYPYALSHYVGAQEGPWYKGKVGTVYNPDGTVRETFEVQDPNALDPGELLAKMAITGMFGAAAGNLAGLWNLGGTAPVGNASGFIGEGVASGVPAWDAAASGAGLDLGGGVASLGASVPAVTPPVGNASGFIGEGVASGVPAWDAAASGAAGAGALPAGLGTIANAFPTGVKAAGSTLLDKVLDKATSPAGLASLAALLAGTSSGGGGGGGYAGYEGGIPSLTATRTQYAKDPTRRPGGAPQRYFSDTTYTGNMNAPGLTQASDPTAGAWQAGNIAELNRLLAANKPTLEQLLASYGLSQADIDHLRGQGVKLPAPAPTAPRPTTPAPAPAAGGDPIAAAWQSGNISGLNALLSAPGAPTLAQLTSQYNLAPADIAHLRGQGVRLAAGGITSLGAYSDGGRMVKGPGDGVSDGVPAVIGGGQPAALATDEFVLPARVVAELGNGSSEAGAKKLYAMMDRVEAAARKAKRGQDSKAERFLPA